MWAAARVGDFSLSLIPAWSWGQAAAWAGVCLCDVCLGVYWGRAEGEYGHTGLP